MLISITAIVVTEIVILTIAIRNRRTMQAEYRRSVDLIEKGH
jgi:hypothetical protein